MATSDRSTGGTGGGRFPFFFGGGGGGGGRPGGGGGGSSGPSEPALTVGTDDRTNSLVVRCSDLLANDKLWEGRTKQQGDWVLGVPQVRDEETIRGRKLRLMMLGRTRRDNQATPKAFRKSRTLTLKA